MESQTITRLQRWYIAHCNGIWEHSYGVKIGTIDNPGWKLDIDVAETELASRPFLEVKRDWEVETWISCKVRNEVYLARGGPGMLDEMIRIFLNWAEQK